MSRNAFTILAPAALLYCLELYPAHKPDGFVFHYEAKEVNEVGSKYKDATKRMEESKGSKDGKDLKGLYYLEMDPETAVLVENEMCKQEFTDKEANNLIYFVSDTLEPVLAGSLGSTNFWSIIGLPKFWNLWKTPDDVELDKVRQCWPRVSRRLSSLIDCSTSLDVEKVKELLSKDEIKELKETFILSVNAKKYIIASTLMRARDDYTFLFDVHGWPFFVTLMKTFAVSLNDSLNMFSRPRFVRYTMYLVIFVMMAMTAISSQALAESRLVKDQAEKMKKLGPEYVSGAMEYYEKQIRRAELMRKAQSHLYDEEGDFRRMRGRLTNVNAKEQLSHYKSISSSE